MTQYATTDANGALTGFYEDSLHEAIPPGAVQLTPTQYEQWLAAQAAMIWQNGSLTAAPAAPVVVVALPVQAQLALRASSKACFNNYALMGEDIPAAWVTYNKALAAIVTGTDTTSTALPALPAS